MTKTMDWYSPTNIKSYDKFLNIIIGGRGIGKTYGFKKDCISRFKKKGKQFLYLRRYKTDLKKINTFLNDQFENFKDDEFKITGGSNFTTFYINGCEMGYATSLTAFASLKSTSYVDVDTIILDEFIPEKAGYNAYIPNEVEIFLNIIDSIFRQREGYVYLLANNVSIVNPYFSYFGITPNPNKEFNTFKGNESVEQILVQICHNEYRKGNKEKSKFHKLISGTPYGDYNAGKFVYDTNDFIKKKTPECDYLCTLYFEGVYYGTWVDMNTGYVYINQQINKEYGYCYSIGSNNRENMMIAKQWRKDQRLNVLIRSYRDGCVYYNNQETKRLLSYILSKY